MKKIYIYIIALTAALAFSSCNSFLEEEPKSVLDKDQYFKTPAHARENVNYLYRSGAPRQYSNAGSAYAGPNAMVDPVLTGYFKNDYESQEHTYKHARELTRQQNLSLLSPVLNAVWDECFKSINSACSAIKYIPGITKLSETESKQLIAEAKFFRAFNYYYLVKTFGAVPLYTEPYENASNLFLERSPVEDIYKLMEEDLTEAVEVLTDKTFANANRRITKHVAAMLLSNVYLRQNKFTEAAKAARVVTGSAHELTTNDNLELKSAFNKLRMYDDLNEVIYAQEFDDVISHGGWWATYAFDATATVLFDKFAIFTRVFGARPRFLNVYDANDLRSQPNQFFHWKYTHPTDPKKVWQASSDKEGEPKEPGSWYYYDENALLVSGRSTKDWNIFRYAEALLNAAEAIAESEGVTAEAAGYLAQIKARADMKGKTEAQYAAELGGLSKTAFVEECWKERMREMPLEFKLWDDCTRTGKFPVISETVKGEVTFVPLVGAKNGAGATFKESDLLWPLPMDELQRNPSLTQNEGYPRQ